MQTATARFSKVERLYQWCREQRIFSTNDVREWGRRNYMSSCDVRVREFVRDPERKLRRIESGEAMLRGLQRNSSAPIAWYEVVE